MLVLDNKEPLTGENHKYFDTLKYDGTKRFQKVKIVKNPSMFLHQIAFTMYRPRIHSRNH